MLRATVPEGDDPELEPAESAEIVARIRRQNRLATETPARTRRAHAERSTWPVLTTPMETRPPFNPRKAVQRIRALGDGELHALSWRSRFRCPACVASSSRAGTFQQRQTRSLFELTHLECHSRRREMQRLGRARKAATPEHFHERPAAVASVTCRMPLRSNIFLMPGKATLNLLEAAVRRRSTSHSTNHAGDLR